MPVLKHEKQSRQYARSGSNTVRGAPTPLPSQVATTPTCHQAPASLLLPGEGDEGGGSGTASTCGKHIDVEQLGSFSPSATSRAISIGSGAVGLDMSPPHSLSGSCINTGVSELSDRGTMRIQPRCPLKPSPVSQHPLSSKGVGGGHFRISIPLRGSASTSSAGSTAASSVKVPPHSAGGASAMLRMESDSSLHDGIDQPPVSASAALTGGGSPGVFALPPGSSCVSLRPPNSSPPATLNTGTPFTAEFISEPPTTLSPPSRMTTLAGASGTECKTPSNQPADPPHAHIASCRLSSSPVEKQQPQQGGHSSTGMPSPEQQQRQNDAGTSPARVDPSERRNLSCQSDDQKSPNRCTDTNSSTDHFCANEITTGLFLGENSDALDLYALRRRGITHVLNVAVECSSPASEECIVMEVPLVDHSDEDIYERFDGTNDFIDRALRDDGKVLVACRHGVSRSATIVIAFLMKHRGMSYDEAFGLLKKKRPHVCPNLGFVMALQEYEMRECASGRRAIELQQQRRAHESQFLVKSNGSSGSLGELELEGQPRRCSVGSKGRVLSHGSVGGGSSPWMVLPTVCREEAAAAGAGLPSRNLSPPTT